MLTSVRFENLKALRDITIPLQPLTVLVGPNGVGKSTVLDGIDYLLTISNTKQSENYTTGPIGSIFKNELSPKNISTKNF